MDHLAILKTKYFRKILTGEKTIESRWYKFKRTPYMGIEKGDMLYLKETGKPVTARATVQDALFFDELDESKIRNILDRYGDRVCIPPSYAPELVGKNYCSLIFLEDVMRIDPFEVDKTGYGIMSAWITLDDIYRIRKG